MLSFFDSLRGLPVFFVVYLSRYKSHYADGLNKLEDVKIRPHSSSVVIAH